tara:strand:- start:226 stop:492 length:267 start_codon:yes stop_codon:yes gene_type:complete
LYSFLPFPQHILSTGSGRATRLSEIAMTPKPISYYKDLTAGGECKTNLTQNEACVVLKIYDYGVDALNDDDKHLLHSLIGKLKDEIWP